MAFLEKLAKQFLNDYGIEIHKVAFVFPTRRARLYFLRSLQQEKPSGMTVWAPQSFSIDDYIAYLSGVTVSDQLDLIFELYSVYKKYIRHYTREFEDFYPWGKMVLNDFDEIDKYLINTDMLFRALKEFKTVEDINKAEMSDIYKRYTGFWEDLGTLYRQFRLLLEKKNKAYEGMVYRYVAQNISGIIENHPDAGKWEKVVFCGLNAISKSEETILRYLLDKGKAEIYWDVDRYFTADESQEAGYFFRQNLKLPGQAEPKWIEDRLLETKFIDIIGVQSRVSQAKVLGIKLQELLSKQGQADNVAVVLPDETLLFPVLNSLPEKIEEVNVTLGFPLQQTPAYSLFDSLMEMFSNALESEGFYHKDVRNVLNHPYIKPFAPDEIGRFIDEMKAKNRVYIKNIDEFEFPLITFPLSHLFSIRTDSQQLMEFFLQLLDGVRAFYRENKPDLFPVDYEYMYHFYTLVSRLQDSLHENGLVLGIRTFRQLFSDIVKNSRIPFTGEPLVGLQVMGMLETQTLDFEHLYVLSVNEGHLPSGKSDRSFIPYEVRCSMNLPTYKDRDAVSAYHFYRLLKNSRHITLMYITETRGIEKSEKSRFIDQLLIEYAERSPNAKIRQYIIDFSFESKAPKEIQVRKNQQIISDLLGKDYSASSLLMYLSCPLKFYFSYILKLKEEEEIFESPEYRQIGTILHETLKELYKPHVRNSVPVLYKDIENMKQKIDTTLIDMYGKEILSGDIQTGRNRIVFEVMKKFLEEFFEKEKQRAGYTVLMLEKNIDGVGFPVYINGEERFVNLKGTIDRLDQTADEVYWIIDYKTGKIGSLDLSSENFPEKLTGQEAVNRKEMFQLFFYRYLLKRKGIYDGKYRLGIYPFKKMYENLKFVQVDKEEIIPDVVVNWIEEVLIGIFRDLFDMEKPFVQTEEKKTCTYCPFINICNKEAEARYF